MTDNEKFFEGSQMDILAKIVNDQSGSVLAIQGLIDTIESYREVRTMLEQKIEDEQASVAALQSENDDLMSKLSNERQEKNNLQAQINQLGEQVAAANGRADASAKENNT